jgi:hypothetical protein
MATPFKNNAGDISQQAVKKRNALTTTPFLRYEAPDKSSGQILCQMSKPERPGSDTPWARGGTPNDASELRTQCASTFT